jgi:hypothetical protein
MRTVTVVEEIRTAGANLSGPKDKQKASYQAESRVPFIRLRGRWLESHGFKPGAKVYIHEGVDGLTLTAEAPTGIYALKPIDEIKAEFKALGIPTEERTKKRKTPQIEAMGGMTPLGIAPAEHDEPVSPIEKWPASKATQLSLAFGELDDEPIPLEHFTLKKISAKAYKTFLKEY